MSWYVNIMLWYNYFCPVPPVVGVFTVSKDSTYNLEVGRYERIQYVSTTGGHITITKTNENLSFTSKIC